MPLIEAKQLKKTYLAGDIEIKAIRGVDLTIEPPAMVLIFQKTWLQILKFMVSLPTHLICSKDIWQMTAR